MAHAKIFFFLVISFCAYITSNAANHYVDKNANGNNNGTSWSNAWESFNDINWNQIQPGDVIYISGGTTSKIYNEQLTVGASGNSTADILIRAGIDAGHNGTVMINRSYATSNGGYGIWLRNRQYITISNITIKECIIGVYVQGSTIASATTGVNDVTLDSLNISYFGNPSGGEGYGILFNGYNNALGLNIDSLNITNCTIVYNDTNSTGNVDCLAGKMINNLYVDNNYMEMNPGGLYVYSSEPGHNDAIQWYFSIYDVTLTNNTFINYCGRDSVAYTAQNTTHSQALMSEGHHGTILIYNNIFHYPYAYSGVNNLYDKNGEQDAIWIVVHNTITSGDNIQQTNIIGSPNSILKNNIFYSNDYPNTGTQFTVGSYSSGIVFSLPTNWNQVDGNLYSTKTLWYGTSIIMKTTPDWNATTMATIVAGGGEASGDYTNRYLVDPLFVSYSTGRPVKGEVGTFDLHLQSGSPARGEGADLQSYIEGLGLSWTDKDGNLRDSSPDCGAYQYADRGPDITPPEVTGATLLDSVTLKIMFSEVLDETTAEDENNYSISNNIDIFNASLSGSEVTLQTTTHSPGSYIVTVVNVEDLASNPISQSNTAEYSLIPPDSLIMFTVEDVYGVIQEPEHTPLKTIDGLGALHGDPDSRWAAEPMPEELIFDLGTNRIVYKTKLSFYRWNLDEIFTYSISISSDYNNWVTIVSQATSAYQEEWTIDEFPGVEARYVKVLFINNNQSNWAGLWEGEIWGIIPTVADPVNNGLPNEFSLEQNYPNPFNPSTTIKFSLPKHQSVKISVYNILGKLFTVLTNQVYNAGTYTVDFDGSALASGFYFYRIETPEFIETKKMILMQ